MRIWTLHPRHLDPKGLVALWREGLLAQAVLLDRTRGYKHHPQLIRFRAAADPAAAIGFYLTIVHEEAVARGYAFDRRRIVGLDESARIPETRGQLAYEWIHFTEKARRRDPRWFRHRCKGLAPTAHPLFRMWPGGVRSWEQPSQTARSSKIGSPRLG